MSGAGKAEVIVVGLGAVGAATLYQLARRGVSAIGIDRFSPPHDRGSSHGETRITRQGVGEGDVYSPFAIRSHAIWRELEAATGLDLLLPCGLLALEPSVGGAAFHGRTDFLDRSIGSAAASDVAHEVLRAEEIARRWPQFILAGGERGYFEPGGGLVYPERCIAAQLSEAERQGATVIRDEIVTRVEETRDGVVAITDCSVHHGATVVIAAGAWLSSLIDLPAGMLVLQPQTLHWFVPDDLPAYEAALFPAFIWSRGADEGDSAYGFPIVSGAPTQAVKIGVETQRSVARPEQRDDRGPDNPDRVYDRSIEGRFKGLSRRVAKSAICLYATTPDSDFAIGRPNGRPRTLIASACSGHGFKHSAAVGEMLARATIEVDAGIPKTFSLERFS